MADPALGVLALHRRGRSSCAPAGTTFSPRSPGSTATETATATDTSSTRRARHRASATSAGRTHGTACSSPTERIPHLPIATAEIQGYVYDAKLRIAELARRLALGDGLAQRLEGEAASLRARFNQDFWSEERGGFYVVGLDGDKRPIDSLTSNIGHLLWSGIVPDERARLVADHLLSDRLFSGWGVRTLSSDDRGYNPIGYHVGTIWPHDNSILALGLARAGFRDAANRIALAQLEAASFTGHRLPEAFAGFERSISRFPVPYPTACSPQAWATGAPFVFIQAMLGLEARDGELRLDPAVPAEIGRIAIRGLHALGHDWDVEAREARARSSARAREASRIAFRASCQSQRNLGAEPCAAALGTLDVEPAAECLDPVRETDKTCAAPGFCPSDPVVGDNDGDAAVRSLDRHRCLCRLRVFRDVRRRLCDEVVDGHLDRLGKSFLWDSHDTDRNGGAIGECVERRLKSLRREGYRVNSARELS